MGLVGIIVSLIVCAIGVVCTLAPIIVEREQIKNADNYGKNYKGSVSCTFIALFIFAGGLIFLFVTLCCSCSDMCMGITIAVVGGASRNQLKHIHFPISFVPSIVFFTICAYALMKESKVPPLADKPTPEEWLFGSIVASASVILCSLTLALS
ncbi:hypothetical protein FBUS_08781 [Fasciolopsis buskii]|uniref:Uncharacterized protein n=1 Tax=Fasciolopsis buskii TaxID=27845 RepID=A0A8E0VE21_9TREM|nr:hypothetical protein FBUS_08781 [Fasciolopsis buski]